MRTDYHRDIFVYDASVSEVEELLSIEVMFNNVAFEPARAQPSGTTVIHGTGTPPFTSATETDELTVYLMDTHEFYVTGGILA